MGQVDFVPLKSLRRRAAKKAAPRTGQRGLAVKARRPMRIPGSARRAARRKAAFERARAGRVIGRAQAARMKVSAARKAERNAAERMPAVRDGAARIAFELRTAFEPRMGEHTGDEEE